MAEDNLTKYLAMTGQTWTEVMQGASNYGMTFILEELIPRALKEKKKIVWKTKLVDGQDLGLTEYELK